MDIRNRRSRVRTCGVLCIAVMGAALAVVPFSSVFAAVLNFNENGASDLAVFDTDTGHWYALALNGDADAWEQQWGWNEAHPVPGDYTGDGKPDLAVYHRESGTWYIRTMTGEMLAFALPWGYSTAHAVAAGDYSGDGKSDLAVFDPVQGKWYIRTLAGATVAFGLDWGWAQAQPIPGDYNGNGKTDLALYDRLSGKWYIMTVDGEILAWGLDWGWPEARPVPGDFNGDGKADLAVFHRASGEWYIRSLDGETIAWAEPWGWNAVRPVSGDFNGDGRTDLAVYNPLDGAWYVRTLDGAQLVWGLTWGGPEKVPLALYGNGSEGFVVVCLGDSITYGRGSSSNGPPTSYPTFLDRRLETALGGFGYVINAGIPGETTTRGRQRFDTLIRQYKPSMVLLMEGTNDLFSEDNGDLIMANLGWMAQRARTHTVSMVMATMAPLVNRPFRDRTAQHQRVIRNNPRIRNLAQQMGWPYAETYFSITSVPNWQNTLFNQDQSIHPNDDGYRIYRDEFIRAMRAGLNSGQIVY